MDGLQPYERTVNGKKVAFRRFITTPGFFTLLEEGRYCHTNKHIVFLYDENMKVVGENTETIEGAVFVRPTEEQLRRLGSRPLRKGAFATVMHRDFTTEQLIREDLVT